MKQNQVTGEVHAYFTDEYFGPVEFFAAVKKNPSGAVGRIHYTSHEMSGIPSWTKMGMATITLTPFSEKKMVEQKAVSLQQEITAVKAEAQNKITELTGKLQQLLALTNEVQP